MAAGGVATIDCAALERLCRECGDGVVLIDVRTPMEFRAVHAVGARNVPLDSLDPAKIVAELGERAGEGGGAIHLICRSGQRSARAAEIFARAGFPKVVSVDGGTLAWERAGYPVERGKAGISIQRQVQIIAGSLTLIGAILAIAVHPYWAGLSAAIGAGLLLTGVTDSCLMGMMLARMPWNR